MTVGAQYQCIMPLRVWSNRCNNLKFTQTPIVRLLECGEYYLERGEPVTSSGSL